MYNILDYISESSEFSFDDKRITEVDNIIFSKLAYFDYSNFIGKSLKDISLEYDYDTIDYKLNQKLLNLVGTSDRFSNIILKDFVFDEDENSLYSFSVSVFELEKDLCYVSFRGSGKDTPSVCEDTDMIYNFPIPSQMKALYYVEELIKCDKNIKYYIGGHSKGGNLALFSYFFSKSETHDNILAVYNNDGPGLPINYSGFNIGDTEIYNIVPRDSIFGRVFNKTDNYNIIKSSSFFVYQHNPFRWKVSGDTFEQEDEFSKLSSVFNDTISNSLHEVNNESLYNIGKIIKYIAINIDSKQKKEEFKKAAKIFYTVCAFLAQNRERSKEMTAVISTFLRQFFVSVFINIKSDKIVK